MLLESGKWWVHTGVDDKWIPNHPTNKVLIHPHEVEWEWRVAELIDWNVMDWDRELLFSIFDRFDAEAIMKIPLSRRYVPDTVVWLKNRNDLYTVKSGYYVARELLKERENHGECSVQAPPSNIWSKLWKLHVPNKIKVFGWRACQNILPTQENLIQKMVVEDGTCCLCQQGSESVIHALWGCAVAQDVWAGSLVQIQKYGTVHSNFAQLFANMNRKLQAEDMELFLVQCWLIWNQRNSVVHGEKIQDPSCLNARAKDYLREFKVAQTSLASTATSSSEQHVQWTPPDGERYKLNFDAAWNSDKEVTGFGAVIHNSEGEVMAALSSKGLIVSDSEAAELLACRKAVEFAVDAGFDELIVEGDCANVMKASSSYEAARSCLGNVVADVQTLLGGLRWVHTRWVSRIANSAAHALAKYAKGVMDDVIWLEETPPPAVQELCMDLMQLYE